MEAIRKAGRPRAFDVDEALHKALLVFWDRGYEGASLAVLQEATGLTAPQLYRAFESKERLYERAVQLYQTVYGFGIPSEIPLTEGVVEYLDRAAREFTAKPGLGCFISSGSLATGEDAQAAAAICRAERKHALTELRRRMTKAVEQGELPKTADVEGLSRSIGALIQGMSVQARDGASYEDLAHVVHVAQTQMEQWKPLRGTHSITSK